MAKENPLDDFPDASPLSGEETDIDQQVDGLRGVLKKDAGELPIVDDDSAGGANMADFGSDFGSDFAAEPEAGGLNDPFGLEDTGAEADFPAPGSDFGGAGGRLLLRFVQRGVRAAYNRIDKVVDRGFQRR